MQKKTNQEANSESFLTIVLLNAGDVMPENTLGFLFEIHFGALSLGPYSAKKNASGFATNSYIRLLVSAFLRDFIFVLCACRGTVKCQERVRELFPGTAAAAELFSSEQSSLE
jgi:hypothetical protein